MGTNHICEREACGVKAASGPKTNCVNCGKVCFLFCYGFEKCGSSGIKFKLENGVSFGLDPSSILFNCANCDGVFLKDALNAQMEQPKISTPTTLKKPSTSSTKTADTSKSSQMNVSTANPFLTTMNTNISKISSQMQTIKRMLETASNDNREIKEVCNDTNVVVKSLNDKASVQNNVLDTVRKQSEVVAQKMNTNNLAVNTPISSRFSSIDFPSMQNSKRKRQSDTPPGISYASTVQQMNKHAQLNDDVKIAVKKRQLIAGNSSKSGLGNAVSLSKPPTVKTQRPILKSIYVSRIENTVTADDLVEYIKQNIPDVNENNFNVRMLVKKDQQIDKLSFVSFRVSCTPDLYAKIFVSSFWPNHVQIGEFFDNPRPKRQELGDFMSVKSSSAELTSTVPETDSKNAANPTDPDIPIPTTSAQIGSAPVQNESKNELAQTDTNATDQSIEMIDADK